MHKRRLLFLFFVGIICMVFFSSTVAAQNGKLPPFRIMQSNGKIFKAEQLPFEKPILIIYFSPECDHCQAFMKEFFKQAENFKKASVVMVTYLPVEEVTKFVTEFGVSRYSNIYVGTEGSSYFLKNYYQIGDMPFTALYDKDGNIMVSYKKAPPISELALKVK